MSDPANISRDMSVHHDLMPSVSDRDLSKSTTTPLNQSVSRQSSSITTYVPPSGSEVSVPKGKLERLKDRLLGRTPPKNPALASKTSSVALPTLTKAETKAAAKADAAQAKAESQKAERFSLALEWGKTAAQLEDLSKPGRNSAFADADKSGADGLSGQLKKLEKRFGPNGLSDEAKRLAKEYGRAENNIHKKGVTLEEQSTEQLKLADAYRGLKAELAQVSSRPVATPEDIRKADAARFRSTTPQLQKASELNQQAAKLVELVRVKQGLSQAVPGREHTLESDIALTEQKVATLSRDLYKLCDKNKDHFAQLSPQVNPNGSLTDAVKAGLKEEVAQAKQTAKTAEGSKVAANVSEDVKDAAESLSNRVTMYKNAYVQYLNNRNSETKGNLKEELKQLYGDARELYKACSGDTKLFNLMSPYVDKNGKLTKAGKLAIQDARAGAVKGDSKVERNSDPQVQKRVDLVLDWAARFADYQQAQLRYFDNVLNPEKGAYHEDTIKAKKESERALRPGRMSSPDIIWLGNNDKGKGIYDFSESLKSKLQGASGSPEKILEQAIALSDAIKSNNQAGIRQAEDNLRKLLK